MFKGAERTVWKTFEHLLFFSSGKYAVQESETQGHRSNKWWNLGLGKGEQDLGSERGYGKMGYGFSTLKENKI